MSIEQTKIIDFVGVEKATGSLVLTISDHIKWDERCDESHINMLQEKINTYMSYIESGQIFEDYPKCKDCSCVISIVGNSQLTPKGAEFFSVARTILENAGYQLRLEMV